jgi:YD repeat-containing protein
MLMRMLPSPVCPQCGSLMPGRFCPRCGAPHTLPTEAVTKPAGSGVRKVLLSATAVLLVILAYFIKESLFGSFFEYLADEQREAQMIAVSHDGPVASVDELKGSGRIYLVQMGSHKAPYALDDFALWLRSKYSLDVQVLPPMASDRSTWDSSRRQYVAELLYSQLKHEHPNLAADPNAYLIGFTDAGMYSVNHQWNSSFTQRDMKRAAVISTDGMQDSLWKRIKVGENTVNELFQTRVRRILLKDVAILYWHLSVNNDPTSLLHDTLDPDIPAEDIYQSDLDPARTSWGRSEGEPCIFFSYSAKDGIKPLPGALIRTCADVDDPLHDDSQELFDIDLGQGLLTDKHTDFYLPDTVPIQFQRDSRDGWTDPVGFGISGSHNYNNYLWSDNMRRITVIKAGGAADELIRVPAWLDVLPLVKWVDADRSGKLLELRWRSRPFEHFDLKRFNGEVEAYLPCSGKIYCYLVGYHNAQGEELAFERDSQRRLIRLTSPNKSWLRLDYAEGESITDITDSRGRSVHYRYDERDRLISATYPSGEVLSYEYDSTQHMLTFSAAPDAKTAPRLLLRNEYEHGRLAKQTFADGKTYSYSYYPVLGGPIRAVRVRTPDGTIFDLNMSKWNTTVRERDPQPKSQEGLPAPE